MHTYDDKSQSENAHALKRELEQWRTRYNYVMNENATLSKQNKELESEVFVLKRFTLFFLFYICILFFIKQVKKISKTS